MMTMIRSLCLILATVPGSLGFAVVPSTTVARPSTTRLFLEDWVADMIDHELYRQNHKKEFDKEWMDKNRGALLHHMNPEHDWLASMEERQENFRSYARDAQLAHDHPDLYCQDRCLTTGNCAIFEEFFQLSPEEVISFCSECVLGGEEEGSCDIPEAFYDPTQLKP